MKFKNYLIGSLLTICCLAMSGFSLRLAPRLILGLHIATGIISVFPVIFFLQQHWWRRRMPLSRHPNSRSGYIAAICLLTLTLSGIALIRWTNVTPLRWLHAGATYLLLLVFVLHLSWRARVSWRRTSRSSLPLTYHSRWLAPLLLTAGSISLLAWSNEPALPPDPPPATVIPLNHDTLADAHLFSAQECVTCHQDVNAQWQTSAHAHAASNPYYLALTGMFIQEQGVAAARYCATCHNPIGLMAGEVDVQAIQPIDDSRTIGDESPAYQARALDGVLSISSHANEGVSCALCHQAAAAANSPQNGTLQLATTTHALPSGFYERLVLRVDPGLHRQSLQPDVVAEAELCGACHNLHLPNGMPLENTYDEWLDSPYPAQGVTCQDCHMPTIEDRPTDSNLPQEMNSHGGIPGKPSSLPGVVADSTLLQQAATLDVQGQLASDSLQVTAVITNTGAGHHLPTGASDLRQMWLAVTVLDAKEDLIWQSGQLDEFGALDPNAIQFHKVLGDEQGRPIELHRIWLTTQVLSDTTLAPLETRHVPYQIQLPPTAVSPYTLTVRLLYRDVSPQFAEFALGQPAHDLPVWEMAAVTALIDEK